MSFFTKYRLEFNDLKGTDWRVDFLEEAFVGTITNLRGQGNPLRFYYDNNDDSPFDPIRETHCTVNIWSMTNFALQDIYSIELMQFQVNIYADDILQWWGYIEPQQYKEGYDMPPYRVSISCTDGLSSLNTEYKNGANYYTGRRYESQIILDCLGKIGHTEFIEYVNIYEDAFNKTVDDSVFDQVLVETYALRELSCIEVITEILQKYNAFIRQKDGVFNIIRPKELIGTSVAGRHFTAYDTKTSVTLTPLQYIKRTGYTSDRWQVPGGVLMVEPPVQKVVINQDYGNRDSWLANYQFTKDTRNGYLLSGYTFEDWTNYGTPAVGLIGEKNTGEDAGLMIPYSADPDNNYIYTQFGVNAKSSSETTGDNFAFEFDWMYVNKGTTARGSVQLKIDITDGTNHLIVNYDNLVWGTLGFVEMLKTAELGTPQWAHFKKTFVGLPSVGPYTIKIFPLYNSLSTIYLGIKDIRFYCSSVNVITMPLKYTLRIVEKVQKLLRPKRFLKYHPTTETIKEFNPVLTKQYTAENAINGYIVSNELSFKLGDVVDNDIDNIPEQFAGALSRNNGTPQVKIVTITLTGISGTANISKSNYFVYYDAVFNGNLGTTASDFVTAHAADFADLIIVTSSGHDIIFTGYAAGYDFDISIQNDLGDLSGIVNSGSAYSYDITPTATWSSRGGSEAKALLQFIADEIRDMYGRPKQLIQMPIIERVKALQINTLGNFQDAVNLYSGAMRIFVMNRGEFDVRNRQWIIDLFEIGTGAVPEIGGSITADSTIITSDNTVITVDSQ